MENEDRRGLVENRDLFADHVRGRIQADGLAQPAERRRKKHRHGPDAFPPVAVRRNNLILLEELIKFLRASFALQAANARMTDAHECVA